jgi:adenylate cyclase
MRNERATTSSATAYDYYLRARDFYHQGRRKSLQYAHELYARAAEADPEFALAYVGIANCCALLEHFYPMKDNSNLRQADEASARALHLAPASAEAHAARGAALWIMNELDASDWEFETAIRLNPRLAAAYYLHGRSCFQRGEVENAVRLFESASALEERHDFLGFAALALTASNREGEARAMYGRVGRAVERHMALNPDDARAATLAAVAHCRLGNRDAGLAWAERASAIDHDDPGILYNVACVFALMGEADRAIDCLCAAVRAGFAHRDWVAHDPDLNSLRDNPRFQAVIDRGDIVS